MLTRAARRPALHRPLSLRGARLGHRGGRPAGPSPSGMPPPSSAAMSAASKTPFSTRAQPCPAQCAPAACRGRRRIYAQAPAQPCPHRQTCRARGPGASPAGGCAPMEERPRDHGGGGGPTAPPRTCAPARPRSVPQPPRKPPLSVAAVRPENANPWHQAARSRARRSAGARAKETASAASPATWSAVALMQPRGERHGLAAIAVQQLTPACSTLGFAAASAARRKPMAWPADRQVRCTGAARWVRVVHRRMAGFLGRGTRPLQSAAAGSRT